MATVTAAADPLDVLFANLTRDSLYQIARELELAVARRARVAQLRWVLRHRASFEEIFAMLNALERAHLSRRFGLGAETTEAELEAQIRARGRKPDGLDAGVGR
jgi:hypothetical protein